MEDKLYEALKSYKNKKVSASTIKRLVKEMYRGIKKNVEN